jgi:hypothetical protein
MQSKHPCIDWHSVFQLQRARSVRPLHYLYRYVRMSKLIIYQHEAACAARYDECQCTSSRIVTSANVWQMAALHEPNTKNMAMTCIPEWEIHSLRISPAHAAGLQSYRCTENFDCLKDLIPPYLLSTSFCYCWGNVKLGLFETAPSTGPTVHPPEDTWQLRSLSGLGTAT